MADVSVESQRGNWLRLLCSGDHEIFAEFVDEYKQLVFLCCKALGLSETEAEDVANETFLAAYQKLSRFRGDSKLSTWLWQIAYYKGINYLRKKSKDKAIGGKLHEQLLDRKIAHVTAKLESSERSERIWDAVRDLPGDWAMAIVLFYREEKTIPEISKIMKKRENTVKTYLFRGRKKLKETLGSSVGDYVHV